MAINGCMDPTAANYNPEADTEDFSCVYLIKHNGQCYTFQDVTPDKIEDRSFTLSYSIEGQCWVFYHDYIPDFYIPTRDKLFNIKNNEMFIHHEGPRGVYHGDAVNPYFIDLIVNGNGDLLLESVQWMTEFMDSATDQNQRTISHITIWNSTQHTGRIALDDVNTRRTKGEWSFNDFRDILVDDANAFLKNIFQNYMLDDTKKDPNPVWYAQKTLQDTWFCIRFEFDNQTDNQVILHDTTVQALKTDR